MALSCLSNIKRGKNKCRPPTPCMYVIGTSCTDRSGSMGSMGKAVKDGMEIFLNTQKEIAIKENREDNTYWRHVTFDTNKDVVYQGKDKTHGILVKANIDSDDLAPRNMTRLYDTALEELEILTQKRLELQNSLPKSIKKLDVKVMGFFTLLTDGQDNQSSLGSRMRMKKAIEKARKEGIVCTFLGANQDAEYIGPEYGFSVGNSLTFSADAPVGEDSSNTGIYNALRSASSNVARACSSGGGDSIGFSGLQRACSSNHAINHKNIPKLKRLGNNTHNLNEYLDSDSEDDIDFSNSLSNYNDKI